MEAMLSGVSVISTVLPGIPELVVNQETGLLVQPNNVEQLSDAIAMLINDDILRDRMIENAISKVKNEFSLQGNAEKLHVLFCSVLFCSVVEG